MGPVKAALEATTRYMAAELGPAGIRVNAISPRGLSERAQLPGSRILSVWQAMPRRGPRCAAWPLWMMWAIPPPGLSRRQDRRSLAVCILSTVVTTISLVVVRRESSSASRFHRKPYIRRARRGRCGLVREASDVAGY